MHDTVCVFSYRLQIVAGSGFKDGQRFLRPFSAADLTSLDKLPHLTGDQWLMLAQWIPLALQDGEGILSPDKNLVRLPFC